MNTITTGGIGVPPVGGPESAYRGPCRILGAHITRVTRAGTALVACTEYCDGVCRLRKAALENLAPGLSDGVAPGETRCIMLTA
jgi:hypothetical protein